MPTDYPRPATPDDILSLVRDASMPIYGMFITPETAERFRVAIRDLATERNLDFDPSGLRFLAGFGNEVFVTESGIEHGFKLFSWPPYIAPHMSGS